MSEEMEVGRQWVARARNDLLNADNNLSSERIPLDTVCFHCQQAAEKLRDNLAILTPYAVEVRYPDEAFMPSLEDARKARTSVERVMDWLSTARSQVVE